MSTNDTVRIVTGTAAAKVFSPFEALGVIKTMPHRNRRWDTNEKCWVISLTLVPELKAALAAEGFKVVIRDVHGRQAAGRERDSASWADALFAELPKPLAERAYKALVAVLHPDRGGDTVAMQKLNAARGKAAVSR